MLKRSLCDLLEQKLTIHSDDRFLLNVQSSEDSELILFIKLDGILFIKQL